MTTTGTGIAGAEANAQVTTMTCATYGDGYRPMSAETVWNREHIKSVLAETVPGQTAWFELPTGQPGRRITAQRINACCWQLWGPGQYRQTSDAAGITVWRHPR